MSKRWTEEAECSDDALSARLRSLPEPEVAASFADSVVSRVEAEYADQVSLGRALARVKSVSQPEVDPSFADGVLARIHSECAEQTAFARLLGRLKALPQPDIHPGFARRVVAAIESGAHERGSRWVRVPAPVLAAVAVAFVIGVSLIGGPAPTIDAPTHVATPAAEMNPAPGTMSESELLARIESRLMADASVQHVVVARFEAPAEPKDMYNSRLLDAFSGPRGHRASEAFIRGADYRTTLRHMDLDQTSTVKQMLVASVREAHEG